MAGIREYIEACQHRRQFLRDQLAWLKDERERFAADVQRLEVVSERIRQETVGYLIPEVRDEYITALEQRLSYPGLSPIKQDYDRRFAAAEARRLELEAMDEIQHYEFQIDQAERDMEDVRPAYDKMRQRVGPWENSKWFSKLKDRGYFEVGYQAGFFRRFFDWRAVSFLMGELAKQADLDFEEPESLRVHYRGMREEADAVFAAFNKRVAERDRIQGLKAEHEELLRAPEKLLAELFHDLGKATMEHLDACPEDLRLELVRDDQNLNAFLRKETGVRKQIQYLRELSVTRIDAQIQQLEQELTKIDAKLHKLEMQRRRGKRKRYSNDDLQRMRNVKADKWERRRSKTAKLRTKIRDFDKYDSGSWVGTYLWWDLMTGGAAANDIFEVREFHQAHPDWDHRNFRDPTQEEAGISDEPPAAFDAAAEDLAASMMTPDDDVFTDAS